MASNKIKYNPSLGQREKNYNRSVQKALPYRFTEDGLDAVLLVGEHQGKLVSQVWQISLDERDLIFSKLYKTHPKMKEIIDRLCCQ